MKKMLSTILLLSSTAAMAYPYAANYDPVIGHVCEESAFTILAIAEQQPRSLLAWIKDEAYIDPTAIIEIGTIDLLVHGKSIIVLPQLLYDCGGQPFLLCTPNDLVAEAKAHRSINTEGDGATSPGMEYILKMYQPEDPKLRPAPPPEMPPIKSIQGEWNKLFGEPTFGNQEVADGRP